MDKKISELDQALQINNDAVFPISQDNGGTDTTYKVSITQISAEVGEDQTFSNLDTTDKTLVGAINEILASGGARYGTDLPMSSSDSRKVTNVINAICTLPTVKSASGSIATFDTDLTENLVECVVDNSATTVTRCGKNFLNPDKIVQGSTTNPSQTNRCSTRGDKSIFITNETRLSFSKSSATVRYAVLVVDNNDTILFDSNWQTTNLSFTLNYNGFVLLVFSYADNSDITPAEVKSGNFQIERSNAPTTFETYQGQTVNVDDWQNITTLNGENNIYADNGNISVKYLETIGKAISE